VNEARSRDEIETGVRKYEKALRIFEGIGAERSMAITLNDLGTVFYSRGQYDKAYEYFEKSLAIRRKIGDPKGEGATLDNPEVVAKPPGD